MERIKNDKYYCEVKICITKISSLRADCFSCKKVLYKYKFSTNTIVE